MDGRGVSLFALAFSLGVCGCLPSQLNVPTNEQKPPPPPPRVEEKLEAAEPKSMNPFASAPKREPKLEAALAQYCEDKAKRMKDNPEQQHRELDEARKIYQEILTYDPMYLKAHRGLGRVYVAVRDLDRAAAVYRKALELYPKKAELYDDMSTVYSMKGDHAAAIQWLQKALAMEPENRAIMFRLAVNLVHSGQTDQGTNMMVRACGRAAGHFYVARQLALTNRVDEARQHAQLALQVNPNYNDARAFLADLDRGQTPVNPPNPNPIVNVGLQLDQ